MNNRTKILSVIMSLLLVSTAGCIKTDNTEITLTDSIPITDSDTQTDTTDKKTIDEPVQKPQSISADKTDIRLTAGETVSVAVKTSPVPDELVWECSDEKVAIADGLGEIIAIGEGKCVVTVRAKSDENIVQSIKVTVIKKQENSSSASENTQNTQTTITYLESNEGQNLLPQVDAPKEKVKSITPSTDHASIAVGQSIQVSATVSPINADSFEVQWSSSNDFIASVDSSGLITANEEGTCTVKVTSVSNPDVSADIEITVVKPHISETNESELPRQMLYIDDILIVNKTYSLPKDYNPGGLTGECSAAFEQLRLGAADDGINIYISSGFRSYEYQTQLYNGYVYYYGQGAADTFSARPGHSEHQTGLAIDCNIISDAFIGTPEAQWLAEHCHEYGFIIRYPKGKESITGYKYEPWHIRYVGTELASEIYESGLTLEEYYGLSSSYDY